MGGCVSQNRGIDIGGVQSAHVISLNGDLLEFPGLLTVSEVLQNQESECESCFLCNSDRLNFNEYISSLNPNYQLEAGQMYFILPESKLHNKLSSSDMAALAVKASLALQKDLAASSHRIKNNKTRISPVIIDIQQQEQDYSENDYKMGGGIYNNQKSCGLGVSKSGSMRKMQRVSSRRAKLAVRSFRLKLSTIDEGATLHV